MPKRINLRIVGKTVLVLPGLPLKQAELTRSVSHAHRESAAQEKLRRFSTAAAATAAAAAASWSRIAFTN